MDALGRDPLWLNHGSDELDEGLRRGLRQREDALFRRAVEASPAAFVLVDVRGRIRLVNSRAESTFGYPRSELIGRPVAFETLHPDPGAPGAGIGLSIVQKIVESIGGRLALESKPGEGSTFRFSAPRSHE